MSNRLTDVRNLKEHGSAKCHVNVYENGIIDFISYNSLILRATPCSKIALTSKMNLGDRYIEGRENFGEFAEDGVYYIEPTKYFGYSATTSKQTSWFLREYFNGVSFNQMKRVAKKENSLCMARLTYESRW